MCYTWKSCYTSESEIKRAYLTTICMKSFHMWSTLWSILWSESEMAKMFSQLIFPPLGTTRKLAGVAELVRFVQQKQKRNRKGNLWDPRKRRIGIQAWFLNRKIQGKSFIIAKEKKGGELLIYKICTWRSIFKEKIMIYVLKDCRNKKFTNIPTDRFMIQCSLCEESSDADGNIKQKNHPKKKCKCLFGE